MAFVVLLLYSFVKLAGSNLLIAGTLDPFGFTVQKTATGIRRKRSCAARLSAACTTGDSTAPRDTRRTSTKPTGYLDNWCVLLSCHYIIIQVHL